MNNTINSNQMRLKTPIKILIQGQSNAGKTYFVSQLVDNMDNVFDQKTTRIVWAYKQWHPLLDEIKNKHKEIIFIQNFPDDFNQSYMVNVPGHKLLIADDLDRELVNNSHFLDCYRIFSHHECFSIIFMTHNGFQKSKFMKDINLHSDVFVIFKNLRNLSQFLILARQLYPYQNSGVRFLLRAYREACKLKYGYLMINLSKFCESYLRFTADIFRSEGDMICWIPSEELTL